jgi:coenzyme F420 biosynthesis associated uncharacterized protein
VTRNTSRLTAGILVGGLLAAGAAVAQREIARRARGPIIDWPEVRSLARGRLRAGGAVALGSAERAQAEASYAEAVAVIEPRIAAQIGAVLPEPLETPQAVDRFEWLDLNLATFQELLGRVEDVVASQTAGQHGAAVGLSRIANRFIGTRQLAYLLGFLGTRVLGQYDLSLLASQGDSRGRLYLVEPNIRATAAGLGIPLADFRTFITIHEATHAFEFEAHPWVRPYFRGLVEETLDRMVADPGRLFQRLGRAVQSGEGHWLERLLTPEQRAVFVRTQALMAVLEGYANHVMHAVGAEILPNFDEVHRRFEERNQRRSGVERLILRLTGLDLKMEQYTAGERFVQAVLDGGGADALARLWDGPATLPTLDEIADPSAWLARTAPPPVQRLA